jgi:hypothetical protein
MNRRALTVYRFLLVYGLAAILFTLAIICSGCASAEGHRMVDDWMDSRSDGEIDAGEMRMLDRDAEALDSALRAPPLPPTGIPWLDLGIAVATAGVAGVGSHRYTMKKRDKTREKALAEVKAA